VNTTLVSLQEYLDTAYSPDREYVDGVVVERHVGERPHSLVLSNLIRFTRCDGNLHVWPTLRVRTQAGRTRVAIPAAGKLSVIAAERSTR
jgi:hypothetical protein